MNVISKPLDGKWLVFWLLTIVSSSFYSQSNFGFHALFIPFNVAISLIVSFFIVYTLTAVFFSKKLYFTNNFLLFCMLLLFTFLFGLWRAQLGGVYLALIGLMFFVTALFLFSLLQYRVSKKHIIYILLVLSIAGLLQAIISIIQVYDVNQSIFSVIQYLPLSFHSILPMGVFQQFNILAVFLAFVLVVNLFLLLQLRVNCNKYFTLLVVLSTILSFYVLILSSSRTGLLAFTIGIVLLVLALRKSPFFVKNFSIWLASLAIAAMLFLVLPVFSITGSDDLFVKKMNSMVVGENARVPLYFISLQMFLDKPWLGYGIGAFAESFVLFYETNMTPEQYSLLTKVNYYHPHNELLYWMIQSGVIVLILVILFIFYYTRLLIKRGQKHLLMSLALISPFLIQSLLSYPFTLSFLHLLLFIFFLYYGMRLNSKAYYFECKNTLVILWLILAIIVVTGSSYGAWHTLKSAEEFSYLKYRQVYIAQQTNEELKRVVYLEHATHNPFYEKQSLTIMNGLLDYSLQIGSDYDLVQYKYWAMNNNYHQQYIDVAVNLVKVYLYFQDFERAKKSYLEAREIFGDHPKLSDKDFPGSFNE